ncbi:ATP-binding cassette domain-containing protein [Paenibacillus sediminis]|uniref:Phosphonate transport system ATP-binding protein n=1 Tax=Paenibacillus sediminis TaxID=664909 RepID=A0ABS4H079_9BACL|nr:ATP-binding cassette domain-containing protein [Paenibacillus sediminis]MBP1935940.1 phosphonate transport system ATP-binding protein [Paenibacillus sediminis]
MIKVEHLTKSIGPEKRLVLHDISVQIEQGEMIAVVGGSGSGKSTLIRCLTLQERWDKGSFIIDEVDVLNNKIKGKLKVRREWAYLEQNPYLNPNRTALKNVLIGRASQTPWWRMLTGMVRSDDYMGAMDVLEQLGLLDKAHQKAGSLSGGEKQRTAIARALVHGAKVIAADEPVIGLDPKTAASVLDTLRKLCTDQQITVIAALPIELAERHATRIWGLKDGNLVLDVSGRKLTGPEKMKL